VDDDDSGDPEGPENELTAERDRLNRARLALRGMHRETRDTAIAAGDPVVDKATNAFLAAAKKRRLATFTAADETAPPFFGRLAYSPPARPSSGASASTSGDGSSGRRPATIHS
jgi:hypothetical protein